MISLPAKRAKYYSPHVSLSGPLDFAISYLVHGLMLIGLLSQLHRVRIVLVEAEFGVLDHCALDMKATITDKHNRSSVPNHW